MLTEILVSLGVAIGFTIAAIVIIIAGVSVILLTEKVIDNVKKSLGDEKFNNIKKFSTPIFLVFVYILIITYMVYDILFID